MTAHSAVAAAAVLGVYHMCSRFHEHLQPLPQQAQPQQEEQQPQPQKPTALRWNESALRRGGGK
jgi:uncharacterized protein YciW